jgi:hypothetical protein
MRDQFSGGKPHLVLVEHVFMKHHRHELSRRFRRLPASIRNQPATILVVIGQLLDPRLQAVERHAVARQD